MLEKENNVGGRRSFPFPIIEREILGVFANSHWIFPCFSSLGFPELRIGHVEKSGNIVVNKEPLVTIESLEKICVNNVEAVLARNFAVEVVELELMQKQDIETKKNHFMPKITSA